MPSTVRQARFAPIPASYSRLPRDDEIYVMKAFAKHCSHCRTCSDPYAVHMSGHSLCTKGLQRALDVTQYVFNKAGKAFSVVDLEGKKRCEVEIPADCDAVRQLLKAIERGLRLRSQSSHPKKERLTSYDENYYVAPRRMAPERDLAYDLKYTERDSEPKYTHRPKVETIVPKRHQSVKQRPVSYYQVGSRGKLPVPSRDEWY